MDPLDAVIECGPRDRLVNLLFMGGREAALSTESVAGPFEASRDVFGGDGEGSAMFKFGIAIREHVEACRELWEAFG